MVDARRERASREVRELYAMQAKAKDSVFGISVEPRGLRQHPQDDRERTASRASAVNVEALVNYFAGPPENAPRRGVRLEVEASPAAIAAEGDHAVLRFTLDTPDATSTRIVRRRIRRAHRSRDQQRRRSSARAASATASHSHSSRRCCPTVGDRPVRAGDEARPARTQLVATVRLHYVRPNGKAHDDHEGRARTRSREELAARLAPPPPRLPRRALGRVAQGNDAAASDVATSRGRAGDAGAGRRARARARATRSSALGGRSGGTAPCLRPRFLPPPNFRIDAKCTSK